MQALSEELLQKIKGAERLSIPYLQRLLKCEYDDAKEIFMKYSKSHVVKKVSYSDKYWYFDEKTTRFTLR